MKIKNLALTTGVFIISSLSFGQIINKGDLVIENIDLTLSDNDLTNELNATIYNNGNVLIYRDLYNLGTIDHINKGTINFFGLQRQKIQTTNAYASFHNMIINNQLGIESDDEFFINNNLQFDLGIISNQGPIIFNENATATNFSDDSYIDGFVRKIGNNNFNFPIGDKSVKLNNDVFYIGSSASNQLDAQYKKESTLIYDHNSKEVDIKAINEFEFYDIIVNDDNSNATLALNYKEENISSNVLTPIFGTILKIVYWDYNLNKWMILGGELQGDIVINDNAKLVTGAYTLARVYDENQALKDMIVYNAVSKSKNGQNDTFYIKGIENYPDNTLQIYNRYGNLVGSMTNYKNESGWKGSYKNTDLPSGTYFYILNFKIQSGETIEKKGYIQLN